MNNNKNKEEIEFRILESKGKALLDREIMETFLSAVHERPQAQEIAKNLVNSYTGVGRILGREMDDLKVIEGVTDYAVAMAAYIGLTAATISSAIIFATITGVFALVIAIMLSEMSKRYIEKEFQKKMFMELEECSSTVNDIQIEPIVSRCRQ